ncbi:EthD domain-containing protein [Labrenzia sp. VG12]|nr:EthD domain-containing protein [Labrenzia sp. VG12]ASP35716.1 ethyl tert-butyl ether degradation protein EthD [Labrenzia sp. VG12]
MIKLIMCLHRRSDLTREEFLDYWQNKHGPFFMENAPVMRARKYVQDQTLSSPMNDAFRQSRGMAEEFDGVAEVWFESEEDLMEAMSAAEGQALAEALLKDEANFIDHARSCAFLVREQPF